MSGATKKSVDAATPHLLDPIDQLDRWLRGDFLRITALEELYFAEHIDVICGRADVDALKRDLKQVLRSLDLVPSLAKMFRASSTRMAPRLSGRPTPIGS